ncbi:MAG: hypothetical protein FJ276_20845 [Planctomycetes bacterium]|nr:hypothetical protein [Planctomycetota bacterium]
MKAILSILTAFLIYALGVAAPSLGAGEQRPNILFILADDLGKEWMSWYGAEDTSTPNVDALAAGGWIKRWGTTQINPGTEKRHRYSKCPNASPTEKADPQLVTISP